MIKYKFISKLQKFLVQLSIQSQMQILYQHVKYTSGVLWQLQCIYFYGNTKMGHIISNIPTSTQTKAYINLNIYVCLCVCRHFH